MLTRREWMQMAGSVAATGAVVRSIDAVPAAARSAACCAPATAALQEAAAGQPPSFCFFSKPLPELGWRDLGRAVKEAGFDGVDLTVRTGGHVLPDRVADDLPRAIEAIAAHGLAVPMITTELTSANAPAARRLLETAARHGVRYFKTGYWHYRSADVRQAVASTGEALAGLAALARECGIQLGFHNHAEYVGAALWDIAPAIDRLDPDWAGYYFDPRHAVAEGGSGAWKTAAHLVAPRLKMVALKDFVWKQTDKGWQTENCPLGNGMVDWAWFGAELRRIRFTGPISVHIEYDVPARTAEERTVRTIEAARRDLVFARRMLQQDPDPAM